MRLALVLAITLLAGCKPLQEAHPSRSAKNAESARLTQQDREFIERATEGNNGEIAIGRLARGRTTRPEILAFGEMMEREHMSANGRLGAIARTKEISLPSSLGSHQAGFDRVVNLRGDRFDEEFLRVMIGDHHEAKMLYASEISGGVDAPLKQYAAATLPKIEAHLTQAQALLDALLAAQPDLPGE